MSDSEKFLISRPNHDIITRYLFAWSKDMIKKAEKENLEVLNLDGDKAKKENFESYIDSVNPKLLVLNGHGDEKTVLGQDDNPLLIQGGNNDLTTDKLLYVRSCRSASQLGKDCTDNQKAKAFIGYEDDFVLIRNSRKTAHPKRDNAAEPIMEASNQVGKTLVEGKTAKEAYKNSQEKHMEKMREILAGYSLEKMDIFNALAANRENQILLGDPQSSL